MSRAFVREGEGEEDEGPPRSPRARPCYLTRAGFEAFQREYEQLAREIAGVNPAELGLDARQIDRARRLRLRELQGLLTEAVPVEVTAVTVEEVRFGATVRLETPEGDTFELTLVGEDEAEPQAGRISWRSPLGQALLGCRSGDEVAWQRPAGELWLTVVEVRYV